MQTMTFILLCFLIEKHFQKKFEKIDTFSISQNSLSQICCTTQILESGGMRKISCICTCTGSIPPLRRSGQGRGLSAESPPSLLQGNHGLCDCMITQEFGLGATSQRWYKIKHIRNQHFGLMINTHSRDLGCQGLEDQFH